MHALFAIGVAVGFAVGAFLGYVLTRRVVNRMATFGRVAVVRSCALAAALVAAVPSSFYAFVLGGNFGGAWAAVLLGDWAVAIGIGFGIAVAFATTMFVSAVVGASLGIVVSRAIGKENAA